jgi:hypothetical protein
LTSAGPSLRLRAVPRALLCDAERGKWERTFDARELGEIIDDDNTCMDVVVNEGNDFFRAPSETEPRARLRRAGMARFIPSDLNSVSPVEQKHAFEDMNESS